MHMGFCWENGGLSIHTFPRGLRATLTLTCPALSMNKTERGRGLGGTASPRRRAGALGRTPSLQQRSHPAQPPSSVQV